ncbi:MAG: hypothetical protein IKC47_04160, partial [Clostridia bacterium]|nr:hypothetical protein [Clostridia bacterium]
MANQTTKQTKNTQENIKNVKTTLVAVDKVQKSLSALRQKVAAIQVEINQREAFLAAPAVEVAPVETKPVVEQKAEAVAPEKKVERVVEVAKTEKAVAPVETKPSVAEKAAEPANESKSAVETKPTKEVKPQKEQKPAVVEVVSTKENDREVKTYTDEKGKKVVRKFWDPSAQSKPAAPQRTAAQQQSHGDRKGAFRPDQQRGGAAAQGKQRFDKGEGSNSAQQRTSAPKKQTAAAS